MTPLIYGLAALPMIGSVAAYRVLSQANIDQETDELVERRIAVYVRQDVSLDPEEPGERLSPLEVLRAAVRGTAGKRLDRSDRGKKFAQELQRADLKLRPEEWIAAVAGVTVLAGALAWMRFGNPYALGAGLLLGFLAPGRFLSFRQKRRIRKFEKGLSETIVTMSSALRSGQSFNVAMSLVAESAPHPLNVEFGRVVASTVLGIQLEDALDQLVKRNNSEDVELLVAAVNINRAVGGNLAEILDTIEGTIRGRVQVKGEIRTLTGQARMSGWIITLLPIFLGGFLTLVSPAYFKPMFHSPIGLGMLGVAGFMILGGAGIIKKIVNIKV